MAFRKNLRREKAHALLRGVRQKFFKDEKTIGGVLLFEIQPREDGSMELQDFTTSNLSDKGLVQVLRAIADKYEKESENGEERSGPHH